MHPLDHLGRLLRDTGAYRDLVAALPGRPQALSGPAGGMRVLLLAALASDLVSPLAVVVPDSKAGHDLVGELRGTGASLPDRELALFPSLDADPYGGVSSHPDTLRARAAALARMASGRLRVLVVPARALLVPLPPPAEFLASVLHMRPGEEHPPEGLRERLIAMGYARDERVGAPGEFASRGYILDLFPPDAESPFRLEFFGDTLASVRTFDPTSQLSTGDADEVVVAPEREFLVEEGTDERWSAGVSRADDPALAHEREALRLHGGFAGFELLHWAEEKARSSLEEYVRDAGAILVVEHPEECLQAVEEARRDFDASYPGDEETALPPPAAFLCETRDAERAIREAPLHLNLTGAPPSGRDAHELAALRGERYRGDLPRFLHDLRRALEEGDAVGIVAGTPGRLDRLAEMLAEAGLAERIGWKEGSEPVSPEALLGKVSLGLSPLRQGFQWPAARYRFVTEAEIFAAPPARKAPVPRMGADAFVSDLRDLKLGDYVVHMDHGIGVYRGLKPMSTPEGTRDFVMIAYRDGGLLYQPVERLDRVQKYSGVEGAKAKLDRLGGTSWRRVKSRIRSSMREMAKELLHLYAARMAAVGRSFGSDTPWQREFEEAFAWEPTPDQGRAIVDVKADMESPRPMDRLVVGDVGYGKTEVAMRAAFKAVMDGTQVAVLTPTTVLAFQHFRTFRQRFEGYPIRIELVSRFRSRKEVKEVLGELEEGKVEVVVGTHRVLSKDVRFKDLGLLIVDEEQRFGVRHKERIKGLTKDVDVLTLTATPIPRTLQMALGGLRDMSMIQTAPRGRLAIHTEVLPWRKEVVRKAISRELERGGQVYFVHNRIGSIHSMASMVRELVPEARVVVGHGQMREEALEDVILTFVRGGADVLVTTTIIENGVDIPRVNTIIVNRADRFGLAQLYQLRGRVGRSDVRAYAYLLVPGLRVLSQAARRRVEALKEFTELGSGFRIAALDLEIRGAGNLLGPQQSGHIAAVGFEMYARLLERTVEEMRGGEVREEFEAEVSLALDIHLPESYIPEDGDRLWVYKRVASAGSVEGVDRVIEEVVDRYGSAPRQLENLAAVGKAKALAEELRVAKVEAGRDRVKLHFAEQTEVDPAELVALVQEDARNSLSPEGLLEVRLPEGAEPAAEALALLQRLA